MYPSNPPSSKNMDQVKRIVDRRVLLRSVTTLVKVD